MYVCVCVCVCVYVCVCLSMCFFYTPAHHQVNTVSCDVQMIDVYVCMRERARAREREKARERETGREREKSSERERSLCICNM